MLVLKSKLKRHQIASSLWKPKPRCRLVLQPRIQLMNIHETPLIAFILSNSHSHLLQGRVKGGGTKEPASLYQHRDRRVQPVPVPKAIQSLQAFTFLATQTLQERLQAQPQHWGDQSTWPSTAGLHPCTVPPAAGIGTEGASGTQHIGDGALPTSVNAELLAHH